VFPRDIVCLRNISVNTPQKGDDGDDDDDNDNNNNNNNNNPTQIKLLPSSFTPFKKVLKDFLQLHSFYTLVEYLRYNRD
jgi:hypothetical protein